MYVLIVDDDADYRHLLTTALERRGHKVEALESAFGLVNRVAATAANRRRPDVVVLDHMLPGLSGGNVLQVLARDRRTSNVPVLLVSNNPLGELEEAATAHPRCRAIQKTGRMLALVEAIEAHTPEG